jgi:glycosyltransferase involved in cell wall biosynthesis
MKIIHCCLSCFYVDNYSYQENELIREHVNLNHDVLVIASTESFGTLQEKVYIAPNRYIGAEGAKVIRLPFARWLPLEIMKKIKSYKGLYEELEEFMPDVIMFHGISALELLTVSRFKKNYPGTIFYVDNHADKNNSARGFFSQFFLHKFFYKIIIKNCLPQIDKVLCISVESMNFCSTMYSIPKFMLEFFPLGGHVFTDYEYFLRRKRVREKFNLNADSIIFLQTGKFDVKKCLIESLIAFSSVRNKNFRFLIAGGLDETIKKQVVSLIKNDNRVDFLGWQDSDSLKDLLCAADVYVQPGSQSATMQMSLCARCPVVLDNVESHQVFMNGNGWLVNDERSLKKVFETIDRLPVELKSMSHRSLKISQELLDYKRLSKRILK